MVSYKANLMFRLKKMYQKSKAVIEKWLSKNEAAIVDREGKSDIWKLFGHLNVKRK